MAEGALEQLEGYGWTVTDTPAFVARLPVK